MTAKSSKPATETGAMGIGSHEFIYEIKRASRKTIKIEVSPLGEVLVTAPKRLAQSAIQGELVRHGTWLVKRLDQSRAMAETYEDLIALRSAVLFGKRLPVVMETDTKKRARIERRANALVATNCGDRLGDKLLQFYGEQTKMAVQAILSHHEAALGLSPSLWTVRSQQRRWGSCNAKREIRFNRLLCLLPLSVMEYVVVHELCHLRQLNHSSAFWKEVAAVLPDYENRRQYLRTTGDGLAACYQSIK